MAKVKVKSGGKSGLLISSVNYLKGGDRVEIKDRKGFPYDLPLPKHPNALTLDLDDAHDKSIYDTLKLLEEQGEYRGEYEFIDFEKELTEKVSAIEKRATAISKIASLEETKLRAIATALGLGVYGVGIDDIKQSIYRIAEIQPDRVLEAIASKPLDKAEKVFSQAVELGILTSIEGGQFRINQYATNASVRSLPAVLENKGAAIETVVNWLAEFEDEIRSVLSAKAAVAKSHDDAEAADTETNVGLTDEELIKGAKDAGILAKASLAGSWLLNGLDLGVKNKNELVALLYKPENKAMYDSLLQAVLDHNKRAVATA